MYFSSKNREFSIFLGRGTPGPRDPQIQKKKKSENQKIEKSFGEAESKYTSVVLVRLRSARMTTALCPTRHSMFHVTRTLKSIPNDLDPMLEPTRVR